MLFPNRQRGQMRPSMGYSPGARTFSGLGQVATIGHMPGSNKTMGDISAAMESNAVAAGVSQSDLDLLSSVGASDNDIADLLNGTISLTALYTTLGVTIAPPTPAPTVVAATPAVSTAQVPPGSTLLYTAQWTAGIGNLSVSPNQAISNLQTALAAHGMSVVNGQATSSGPINYAIQVTVLDTIGNALQSDAKSVLDALMQQIVGNNLSGTMLSIVQIGSSGSVNTGITATLASNPLQWLENNALYIGAGIAAVILLNSFLQKKR